ncbi:hypothetical protein CHISP_0811 [Chitinispirillum alkaliphilum]|nr:hypothetical protein CHISP_0811 [Chitinispirillum alkaliphilum]
METAGYRHLELAVWSKDKEPQKAKAQSKHAEGIMLKKIVIIMSFLLLKSCTGQLTADTSTYFPLVVGSVWEYVQMMDGEVIENSSFQDSLVELIEKDSVLMGKKIRTFEAGHKSKLLYKIKNSGLVYLSLIEGSQYEPFCLLIPEDGVSIGRYTYNTRDESTNTVLMTTGSYKELEYEKQLQWQFKEFRKGIGLTAWGGSEIFMKLIKYRIGNDE